MSKGIKFEVHENEVIVYMRCDGKDEYNADVETKEDYREYRDYFDKLMHEVSKHVDDATFILEVTQKGTLLTLHLRKVYKPVCEAVKQGLYSLGDDIEQVSELQYSGDEIIINIIEIFYEN